MNNQIFSLRSHGMALLGAALIIFCSFIGGKSNQKEFSADLIVYGGTSTGISAAIQASRMGKSVILIEPTQRIGGLTTGGLGATDIGNKNAIGGISREFYQNIKKYYDDPQNWKWQKHEDYKEVRNVENQNAMWTFEPSAALSVFKKMMDAENIEIVYGEKLNRKDGVKKNGAKIIFIDGKW